MRPQILAARLLHHIQFGSGRKAETLSHRLGNHDPSRINSQLHAIEYAIWKEKRQIQRQEQSRTYVILRSCFKPRLEWS